MSKIKPSVLHINNFKEKDTSECGFYIKTFQEHKVMHPELEILIEQHFKEHQPISFYSEKLHISSQQLNVAAKNYLNKTVMEMLQERMIAEAKRLQAYSTLSISEIGYELNFNDNSYFNCFFKKTEEITPEQFRKHFINTID